MIRLQPPANGPEWLPDYTRSIEQALVNAENALAALTATVNALTTELPWTTIETQATTSGSTVTFANIPQTYSDLSLVFVGVSTSLTDEPQIALSDDGTNFSAAVDIFPTGEDAAGTYYGALHFPDYKAGNGGAISGGIISLTSTREVGFPTRAVLAYRIPGALTHIRISVATGAFDAGSIILRGR